LCEAYRCKKNVWKNREKNQWTAKKIKIIAIYVGEWLIGLIK
jgi:hypothetical protein